jgi:hypothetical protein
MKQLWDAFLRLLERTPSGWGIPLLVVLAVLLWLGVLKLFGL